MLWQNEQCWDLGGCCLFKQLFVIPETFEKAKQDDPRGTGLTLDRFPSSGTSDVLSLLTTTKYFSFLFHINIYFFSFLFSIYLPFLAL